MKTIARHLMIPSKTTYLSLVRVILMDLLQTQGVSDHDSDAVVLAVDEALTNSMKHAHRGRLKGEAIGLNITLSKNTIAIIIVDKGRRFTMDNISRDMIQTNVAQRRRHGYGLYLIQTLMDRIKYQRTKEGNRLMMTKFIQRGS